MKPEQYKNIFLRNNNETIMNNLPENTLKDDLSVYADIKHSYEAFLDEVREMTGWNCIKERPLIGIHQSFHGLSELWRDANEMDNLTFQCFIRNNRNMQMRKGLEYEVPVFNGITSQQIFTSYVIHAPYVMNPASGDTDKVSRALNTIQTDFDFLKTMSGNKYYVLHPGAYTTYGYESGVYQLYKSTQDILRMKGAILCLETMGGEGTQLLSTVNSWELILKGCPAVHFCIDTCHLFAAGISFDEAYSFFKEHPESIGVLHVNDSQKPFGSRVDRHACIGYGCIPTDSMLEFIQKIKDLCPRVPIILETPVEHTMESLTILKREIK